MNAFYFLTKINLAKVNDANYNGSVVAHFEYKPSLKEVLDSFNDNCLVLSSKVINSNAFYIKIEDSLSGSIEDCIYIISEE